MIPTAKPKPCSHCRKGNHRMCSGFASHNTARGKATPSWTKTRCLCAERDHKER